MNFEQLSDVLRRTSDELVRRSVRAVNVNLTIRNWLFGYYIVEYEQNGEDRARYGSNLLKALSESINIRGLGETSLKICRQFYIAYPGITRIIADNINAVFLDDPVSTAPSILVPILKEKKRQTLSDESPAKRRAGHGKGQSISGDIAGEDFISHFRSLLTAASFHHFTELIKIEEPVKRRFYELIILKTTPSVRELRRQIETLTYERVNLSNDPVEAFNELISSIVPENSNQLVKSHYFFEFLNIHNPELIEESDLERALIGHLQEFMMELGNGFCFEARQKRILIGDEYFFIDLVFYHRVLKCHVLIELKTEWVKHEHIGQMKVYLQHYKRCMMARDDNPPVGILLVTGKNRTLVEYAVADADREIFVSKYQLQLPDKKALERFIRDELRKRR